MDFNFMRQNLKKSAFSQQPFKILDPREKDAFANVMEILLLETGGRHAWQQWQEHQFSALISYSKKRSAFWRNRLSFVNPTLDNLKYLPILTRKEVTKQVNKEGALLSGPDKAGIIENATSGSSGTPVRFFSSVVNAKYGAARAIAQDIMEQRDFRENRIRVTSNMSDQINDKKSRKAARSTGWLGPLANVFEHGHFEKVKLLNNSEEMLKKLRKHPPHNLICSPSIMDMLLNIGGIDLLKELGVNRWIQYAGHRSYEIDQVFEEAGIEISANYSCEEAGLIAFECSKCPGFYHVVVSNVIVEADDSLTTEVHGDKLSRILITHLHSFATPFIRYDIGDFGKLSQSCSCGHDGPTLSKIYGRNKQFIFFPDGRYVSFYCDAKDILSRVQCSEYQIHQNDINNIVVQIGGRKSLTEEEERSLIEFIRYKTGSDFNVEVRPVKTIDWRSNPKQLGFTSAVG